jgi:hypothetical protein
MFDPRIHVEEDAFFCLFENRKRATGQIEWVVAKGAALPVDLPRQIRQRGSMNFLKGQYRTSTFTLYGCDKDVAPSRTRDKGLSSEANRYF